MNLQNFIKFIVERHRIYLLREAGMAKPWTLDPILQSYRFCNIYRELDKETRWIHDHWLEPNQDAGYVWFAAAIARHVNLGKTLSLLPYPVPWRAHATQTALERCMAQGKTFSGAYMIACHGVSMPKPAFVARVGDLLWGNRIKLEERAKRGGLEYLAKNLQEVHHIGSFMSGQIVADAKHFDPLKDRSADWWTWCTPGPGSLRGLNRLHDKDIKSRWGYELFKSEVNRLKAEVNSRIPDGWAELDAQNIQNCLCEFDKYERVRLGEGRPKSTYNGRG